jgi:hypothetical protein
MKAMGFALWVGWLRSWSEKLLAGDGFHCTATGSAFRLQHVNRRRAPTDKVANHPEKEQEGQ